MLICDVCKNTLISAQTNTIHMITGRTQVKLHSIDLCEDHAKVMLENIDLAMKATRLSAKLCIELPLTKGGYNEGVCYQKDKEEEEDD